MFDPAIARPEDVWPVDAEYAEAYGTAVACGRQTAKELDVVIVGIARNAMPALPNTLHLASEVLAGFRSGRMYVYENDSTDGTDVVLRDFAEKFGFLTTEHETLGGIDSRGFEPARTERLARARNKCLEWVRSNAADASWTIVLDLDPAHGFSVDGVFNSIAHLSSLSLAGGPIRPGGMASYSLFRSANGVAHYDAWAARPVCWWRDRRDEIGFTWFNYFLPPVGSPPCPMNSAFGGLGVYRTAAFLSGGYSGEDCEHVPHHRRMRRAGYQMYLNPGSRYISTWQD